MTPADTEAKVYETRTKHSEPMGTNANIFQADIFCAQSNNKENNEEINLLFCHQSRA